MQIKSEKGLVGSDVAIGIIILMLFVAIAGTIFSQISVTNMEIKRNSVASNCAVSILEKIAGMSYDDFQTTTLNKDWCESVGIDIPKGYDVEIKKIEDVEKKDVLTEVSVSVTYSVREEGKAITIKTLKTR